MAEELGKIEKPPAEGFKQRRKLYFVPLIYSPPKPEAEYGELIDKYWEQVSTQVNNLELKLGHVDRIYHELIPVSGKEGIKAIKELNEKSHQTIKDRLDRGAQVEATEDPELLTEFMDWSKCLAVGLQNLKVFNRVYESYTEASKKRNEFIARQIDETIKENETAILLMREGHQVQFPSDIQVFYVTPPALDEIKRLLRERESQAQAESSPSQGRKKRNRK